MPGMEGGDNGSWKCIGIEGPVVRMPGHRWNSEDLFEISIEYIFLRLGRVSFISRISHK